MACAQGPPIPMGNPEHPITQRAAYPRGACPEASNPRGRLLAHALLTSWRVGLCEVKTARRVGCCWDVSRCVYKAWLALVVESCRAGSVCVCLAVSVVFRLNERPVNADHTAFAIMCRAVCPHRRPRARVGCWWRVQSAQ